MVMQQPKRGRRKGTPKTGGRVKGVQNKITRTLKEMIEQALEKEGGVDYLCWAAREEPAAFLSLLGKTLPKDVNVSGEVKHTLEQLITQSFKPADASDSSRPH